MLTRRRFLQSSGAAAAAFILPGGPRPARAAGSDPVLVAVNLRGGADGLNLVVPAGDPDYYTLRPDIQVAPGAEIPLDGFFGLHPSLIALEPLYRDGDLALLHAAGSPDGTRSHFDAQDFMERAAPSNPQVGDGWLNRALLRLGAGEPWAGISIGSAKALALAGDTPSLAMTSIADFAVEGPASRRSALEAMYAATASEDLRRAANEAFRALEVVTGVAPGVTGTYPPGPYGAGLADAAALIRADIGTRIVTVDLGGWDHHEGEAAALEPVASQLAAGLAAFREDLGAAWGRVCVLMMTEFGRTAAQNGSVGTDHGHGSVMMAAGGAVSGGRVLVQGGAWPGLAPAALHEGRDLAVTTDFRNVFAEVLARHLGLSLAELEGALPDHPIATASFPGLFA